MSKRLMRTCYPTDVSDQEPEYIGVFSNPFPDPKQWGEREIVGVDWSERGFVWVTYLVPA